MGLTYPQRQEYTAKIDRAAFNAKGEIESYKQAIAFLEEHG